MLVEEFIGEIPASVKEPAIDFLTNGRIALERFFTIQAYKIQKRSIGDVKNAQLYAGILLHIRSLLSVLQKGKIEKEDFIVEEKKEEPANFISDFVKGIKNYGKEEK